MSAALDPVFVALGDATRRGLLVRLVEGGPETATALAAELPITRQAVARHLGVLGEAGLVEHERIGRETRYRPRLAPLADATEWMAAVGARWDDRLGRLARLLEDGAAGSRPSG